MMQQLAIWESAMLDDHTASLLDGEEAKLPSALKTISEVAKILGVPQHVLRFWETKFPQIKPLKMRGGRRYYRPEDIAVVEQIRSLLYDKGFTIKGAKQFLRDGTILDDMGERTEEDLLSMPVSLQLRQIKHELEHLRDQLRSALALEAL